jgi:predicted nucleic acid-binding protein
VIFIDTGFLFAYVSADDKDHERVNQVLESHRGQRLADFLLTTNHVVAETITLVGRRGHRDPGVRHDLASLDPAVPQARRPWVRRARDGQGRRASGPLAHEPAFPDVARPGPATS